MQYLPINQIRKMVYRGKVHLMDWQDHDHTLCSLVAYKHEGSYEVPDFRDTQPIDNPTSEIIPRCELCATAYAKGE